MVGRFVTHLKQQRQQCNIKTIQPHHGKKKDGSNAAATSEKIFDWTVLLIRQTFFIHLRVG